MIGTSIDFDAWEGSDPFHDSIIQGSETAASPVGRQAKKLPKTGGIVCKQRWLAMLLFKGQPCRWLQIFAVFPPPEEMHMINLLAPMQSTGFIISDEQPVTLTNDTDIWNHIKKAINLHGVTTHVFQTERSRL